MTTEPTTESTSSLPPPVPAPLDPEVAEEYAESISIDPTPEQIDRYLQLEGDEPLGEVRDVEDEGVTG